MKKAEVSVPVGANDLRRILGIDKTTS